MTTKHNLKDILSKKKWYYLNSDITEQNFPVPEKIETEGYKILKMEKSFTLEEALERMKKEGLRPANIYELVLFATNHPEEFPEGKWTLMLAFGQTWTDSDGDHRVPSVRARSGGDFEFNLGYFEGGWDSDGCLLCFCDPS